MASESGRELWPLFLQDPEAQNSVKITPQLFLFFLCQTAAPRRLISKIQLVEFYFSTLQISPHGSFALDGEAPVVQNSQEKQHQAENQARWDPQSNASDLAAEEPSRGGDGKQVYTKHVVDRHSASGFSICGFQKAFPRKNISFYK